MGNNTQRQQNDDATKIDNNERRGEEEEENHHHDDDDDDLNEIVRFDITGDDRNTTGDDRNTTGDEEEAHSTSSSNITTIINKFNGQSSSLAATVLTLRIVKERLYKTITNDQPGGVPSCMQQSDFVRNVKRKRIRLELFSSSSQPSDDDDDDAKTSSVIVAELFAESSFLGNTTNLCSVDLSRCNNIAQQQQQQTSLRLGDGFLAHCPNLKAVQFPDNIVTIGNGFLTSCAKLERIEFSKRNVANCTLIGNNFVAGCRSLKQVKGLYHFGKKLHSIGKDFLANCTSVGEIEFFAADDGGCDEFGANLKKIPDGFLSGCSALKVVSFSTFPSVAVIEDNFCQGCLGLTEVRHRSPRRRCVDDDGGSFKNVDHIGTGFMAGNMSLRKFSFESFKNLEMIENSALSRATCLQEIDFSGLEQLQYIGNGFCGFCLSLQRMEHLGALKQLSSVGDGFLQGCRRLAKIDCQQSGFRNLKIVGRHFFNGSATSATWFDFRGAMECLEEVGKERYYNYNSTGGGGGGFRTLPPSEVAEEPWFAEALLVNDFSSSSSAPSLSPVVLLSDRLRIQDRNEANERCTQQLSALRKSAVWTMRKHVILIRHKSSGCARKAMEVWNIMTTTALFL